MATILHKFNTARSVCVCVVVFTFGGCESPEWTRSLNDSFLASDKPSAKTEEQHRQEYEETHSPESMRWLLSHCVEMGMSYKNVCHIMGEDGTPPETSDRRLLAGGGNYRVGDEMYAWSDSKGRTVYLAFREDRLVNFDRSEFK
jgi:hypothetical protein